jgi:catechol 2,3-dioxygenase-like lactoylglutathione lyase family enzyme
MPVLIVNDIERSKIFYQELFSMEIENDFGTNISFKNAFSLWEKNRAEEIIFNSEDKIYSSSKIKNMELYFESDNIEALWNKLREKNIEFIHEPREEPWGQKTLRFLDPDKYIIEIAEPMENLILRLFSEGYSESEIAQKTQMNINSVKEVLSMNNVNNNL